MSRLSYSALLCFAAAEQPSVVLNNGVRMPLLGLGTNGNAGSTPDEVASNVKLALSLGFQSIDTAADYPLSHPGYSLQGVGQAIRNVSRDSVFLISKVSNPVAATVGGQYNAITKDVEDSMKLLNTEYVDLMLLHFPPVVTLGSRCKAMQEQWRALEDFQKAGKARAIGVSNYCQADIECLAKTSKVVPAVNQIQFHVGMGADPLGVKSYCDSKGIVVQAYSPLQSELITGDLTTGIGKNYNKTGAQVALRWIAEHNMPFNTASSNPKHLQQDLEVFDFKLNAQDLSALDSATSPAGEPNGDIPLHTHCGPVTDSIVV